jgi:hypothetical protein
MASWPLKAWEPSKSGLAMAIAGVQPSVRLIMGRCNNTYGMIFGMIFRVIALTRFLIGAVAI